MAAGTIFRILFFVLFGGVLVMRLYFMLQVRRAGERIMPDRQAVQREGRLAFAARLVMFFFLITFLVLYVIDVPWMAALELPFPAWLRWIGYALGFAGLLLWAWAQVCLGKEWSPQLQLREKHHLITSGPYRTIRHPIYTAMFVYGIGLALVTAHWVFVGLAVLVILGLMARVPKEEQMMLEEFGEEYRSYMQRTGAFFPRQI